MPRLFISRVWSNTLDSISCHFDWNTPITLRCLFLSWYKMYCVIVIVSLKKVSNCYLMKNSNVKINNEWRNYFRYIDNIRDSSILRGVHLLWWILSNKNLTLDVLGIWNSHFSYSFKTVGNTERTYDSPQINPILIKLASCYRICQGRTSFSTVV